MRQIFLLVALALFLIACGADADETETVDETVPAPAATEQGSDATAESPPATQAAEPVTEPPVETTAAPTEPAEEEATQLPAATVSATSEPAARIDSVALERVAGGFTSPVAFIPAPDNSGQLFVVDQIGLIYLFDPAGQGQAEPFLDLRDRIVPLNADFDERGLLGMDFHPAYRENGRFFVYYSAPLRAGAPEGWNHTSHVSEFTISEDNPRLADPASEQILIQIDQPQGNHNGGQITFGPDGYLYIPLGDGGGANDVGQGHVEDWYEANGGGNGQDIGSNLLGSILRIDVDVEGTAERPYGIPEDNPLVGRDGLEEIWAYGFRNPFRIAFDQAGDQALYVGDAGQSRLEEIDTVTAGGNYGWNVKEGTTCFNAADPTATVEDCPDTTPDGQPLIDPVIEYQNANMPGGIGLAVIGGYVYRGSALPGLVGEYLFGDWSETYGQPQGKIFAATPSGTEGELWEMRLLHELDRYVLSFGQDETGELYVLTTEMTGPTGETGEIYRLVAGTAATGAETTTPEAAETAVPTGTTDASITAGEAEVLMQNVQFVPDQIAVPPGTTVVWPNLDSFPHTVTAGTRDNPSGLFDSGNIEAEQQFSFTFEESGSYDYFCALHPGMEGIVVVEPAD